MYRLFSHNDLDGVSCGIIAKCAFGDQAEVHYVSVAALDDHIRRYLEKSGSSRNRKDQIVFITDLSVNEENERRIQEFSESGRRIKLIDHHKTSLHYNRYKWGAVQVEYDDGRLASAASLFYEYLVQQGLLHATAALDEYVDLVRQYDTWEWDKTGNTKAKRLNDLFYLMSPDEFEEKMVTRMLSGEPFEFDEFEEKILQMEEEKIERYIRRKRRELVQLLLDDRIVGIVHAESYHSELGNELGKAHPHLDYIAILNVGGKKISLRTIHDEIDVSEIAGRFGGGGHAKASGCPMTEEAYRRYVQEAFPLEAVREDAFKTSFNRKGGPYGSLYEDRNEETFFLFPYEDGWRIEHNGSIREEAFGTFEAAERKIKRDYAAWLVRDDRFVAYLSEETMTSKGRR